jgi:hypothetical protein
MCLQIVFFAHETKSKGRENAHKKFGDGEIAFDKIQVTVLKNSQAVMIAEGMARAAIFLFHGKRK